MPQIANPYGLSQSSHVLSLTPTDKIFPLEIQVSTLGTTNVLGYGDPVSLQQNGIPVITPAPSAIPTGSNSALVPPIGVFIGCRYTLSTGQTVNAKYLPAFAAAAFLTGSSITYSLNIDPYYQYKVQTTAAFGTANSTQIGNVYNLTTTAPNSFTGESNVALIPTALNTANANWGSAMIIGLAADDLANGYTNAWTDPYVDVIVVLNSHQLKVGQFGI